MKELSFTNKVNPRISEKFHQNLISCNLKKNHIQLAIILFCRLSFCRTFSSCVSPMNSTFSVLAWTSFLLLDPSWPTGRLFLTTDPVLGCLQLMSGISCCPVFLLFRCIERFSLFLTVQRLIRLFTA